MAAINQTRRNIDRLVGHHLTASLNRDAADFGIVGLYGCPYSIGNYIHFFLNAFVTSIVTGRGLVGHYVEKKGLSLIHI